MTDIIEARIEKLVFGGDGLARVDGRAVFIPYTAPGDLVRARIVESKKRFARAELVEVLEPGPDRREPPCPYFGPCGGCQIQHIAYEAQVRAKGEFVRDAIERIGRLELPGEIPVRAAPDAEFGYRIRATAHVAHTSRGTLFGYFGARSHRIVDVESCPLLVEELDEAWRRARAAREGLLRVRHVELAAGDGGAAAEPPIAAVGGSGLVAHVDGVDYGFSPAVFFQANRPLLADLVRSATGGESGALAVDLYAGVGLFAIPLARAFDRVVAVEGFAAAADLASANAAANGAANVEVLAVPVEDWLDRAELERAGAAGIDLVLLDPPRAGLGEAASRTLADLGPSRIVYVSCDPTTLARDLRVLVDGGYRLESVEAFDLFPQTYHVETVARLSRSGR